MPGNRLARKSVIKRLAGEYRCTPGEIENAIAEIDGGIPCLVERLPRAISWRTSTGR